ncbi:ATP-binding protein [Albirhodobacter sp. R86504]|uniref:ATP-binding protein n=1 Tax=Albirhodobacter sp. R86504 TaxID=3093848 RepID=UPI00366B7B95
MTDQADDRVSRRRYQREQMARAEAETLLEQKSRQLFEANKQLSEQSSRLEQAVSERTAELSLALNRAEAASTARSRFVATMSHEIRTPLGGMLGMIDLLSIDEQDPEKKELLDYAKTAGLGLSRIVNDVLDFSKMEAGVFVFEEEHVDIRALVESIRILAASSTNGKDRPITTKVDASVPKLFLGDATRIRQVISNLTNNALRYSLDGPIILKAKASPHPKGALLRVEVEDFGVGIAQEQIGNLFKDFSQIANSLTAAAQGTGLGLAICKRIMEGCGGEIGVESAVGSGSTFWFELPVEIVEQTTQLASHSAMQPEAAMDTILQGKRVLIAEDNIINQKLLLTYAKRMELVPELAENGRIALERFSPDDFDLVLMDVAMPEMDGLEATRRIREKWAGRDMPPILILTAHVMDAIETEAKLVGVDVVLSKPIPYDDLKHALQIAIAGSTHQSVAPSNDPVAAPETDDDLSGLSDDANKHDAFLGLMSPVSADELVSMFGMDELIDFARKYVVDSSDRLVQIETALVNEDWRQMSEQAHSIKGASLVFGFADIPGWAEFIEKAKPAQDLETVRRYIENIRERLSRITATL